MEGAGKDVARGGEKIQDASIKVRNDWRNARDSNERDYDTARTACMAGNDANARPVAIKHAQTIARA
jgi:hypothetical protein